MSNSQITVRVLAIVNEERNSYGLRYNDHARYRSHCSNKIHRLRQKLKLTHGKGKEYKKTAPVPLENLTNEHLHLLLFEAERAWAYSQELLLAPGASQDGTIRHRATGRFRRAVRYATELQEQATLLFPGRISASSLLEVNTYLLILSGRFMLRREDFQPSVENLSVARSILDELSSSAPTSRDQALYIVFSDEIAPEIRFAAHSMGRSKAYDIDGIVAEVVPKSRKSLLPQYDQLLSALHKDIQSREKQAGRQKLREIIWEGRPVPIRNPDLVDVFLKVQIAEDGLTPRVGEPSSTDVKTGVKGAKVKRAPKTGRSRIASYDAVLLALTDAEEVARKLAESHELSGSSSTQRQGGTLGAERDIHFIHAFTQFRLLSRRIERDLLLVSSLTSQDQSTPAAPKAKSSPKTKTKPTASDPRLNPGLVKLFDTILQSLEQMRTLSIVDESAELVPLVDGRLAYSKARRILYLARTYSYLQKYVEALALTAKAHIYVREARSLLSSVSEEADTSYPVSLSDLATFDAELASDELKTKVEWYAYNGGHIDTLGKAQHAAHKKPVFFDSAFNYIELPMDRLLQRAGKAPAPALKPVAISAVEEKEKRSAKMEQQQVAKEEEVKAETRASSGFSGILGGWWGRK